MFVFKIGRDHTYELMVRNHYGLLIDVVCVGALPVGYSLGISLKLHLEEDLVNAVVANFDLVNLVAFIDGPVGACLTLNTASMIAQIEMVVHA